MKIKIKSMSFLWCHAGLVSFHFEDTSIHFGVLPKYWKWLWSYDEWLDYFGLGPIILIATCWLPSVGRTESEETKVTSI